MSCYVYGCDSKYSGSNAPSFHRFPSSNPERICDKKLSQKRLKAWIEAVKIKNFDRKFQRKIAVLICLILLKKIFNF